MWPFRKKEKKPEPPEWWEAYPPGLRISFVGRDVISTGPAWDADGVYGISAVYADNHGVIHWVILSGGDLAAAKQGGQNV